MTHLPRHDPADVATKADITDLKSDIADIGKRLDRLFLTLVAGLFVIVAAMVGVVLATL